MNTQTIEPRPRSSRHESVERREPASRCNPRPSLLPTAVALSCLAAWTPSSAHADLSARDLDGDLNAPDAYFESTAGITWLADFNAAGQTMNWPDAMAFSANFSIGGYADWRLPKTFAAGWNGVCNYNQGGTSICGYLPPVNSSEMIHLRNVTLGNIGYPKPGWGITNPGPLVNFPPGDAVFWSSTQSNAGNAWVVGMYPGDQGPNSKTGYLHYSALVTDGDVGSRIEGDVHLETLADFTSQTEPAKAFPGTMLIGNAADGSIDVSAASEATMNSTVLGYDPYTHGMLTLESGAHLAIQPLHFPNDCPTGPNCTGLNFNATDSFTWVGLLGSGSVLVHTGATLDAGRAVVLGALLGGDGTLTVDGGTVNAAGIVKTDDGNGYSALFDITVGENEQSYMTIGAAGTGLVQVRNGGTVNVNRIADESLGDLGVFGIYLGGDFSLSGGHGQLDIDGAGSSVNINGDNGALFIGFNSGAHGAPDDLPGTGVVNVTAGGSLNLNGSGGGIVVGGDHGTVGELNVTGDGAVVQAGSALAVGWNQFGADAGTGTVNIRDRAHLVVDGNALIGYRGSVNVDGAGSELRVRGTNSVLVIGVTGTPDPDGTSTASMSISNGGHVVVEDAGPASGNFVGIADSAGGRAKVRIEGAGSVLDVADGLAIGANATMLDSDPSNDIAGGHGVVIVANGGELRAPGGIVIGNDGLLGGNGLVTGTIILLGNGTVSPGLSPGTLVVDGSMDLTRGGILRLEIDSLANFDRIIASGGFSFSALSTIEFVFGGGFDPLDIVHFAIGDFLRIGTPGTDVGADAAFDLPGIANARFRGRLSDQSLTQIQFDPQSGFHVAAVPLPGSVWLLLSSGSAIGVLGRRRRAGSRAS